MYIVDTVDSLIEYLCKRVLLMPAPIRYFAKAVFEHHKALFAAEKDNKKSSSLRAVQKVAEFIFEKWLVTIISQDMVLYGLTKTYYLKQHAICNLQLIGMGLQKIFALDDTPYEEELFAPLNELYRTNQDRVLRFWQELLEVPGYLNLKAEHSEIMDSVFAPRPGEREDEQGAEPGFFHGS